MHDHLDTVTGQMVCVMLDVYIHFSKKPHLLRMQILLRSINLDTKYYVLLRKSGQTYQALKVSLGLYENASENDVST